MTKQKRNRLAIATLLAAIAAGSWVTPYNFAGCATTTAPGMRCLLRNSGLTAVRWISLGFLILVCITPVRKDH